MFWNNLELEGMNSKVNIKIQKMLGRYPGMKQLVLKKVCRLSEQSVKMIPKLLPEIEELRLVNCGNFSPSVNKKKPIIFSFFFLIFLKDI